MNTKALRQKILDLAIHGKLVPQDPNDEPASVLLERIRDEKERLIKEGKIKRPKKAKATSDKPHYPYELPKGWVWCKLSDCCHIAGRIGFRGYTKDDLVEFQKGAITLSPSNIIDGEMDYNKCTYISWDKYEESPEIEVLEGDILLVKTGSSFGKCALVDKLPWKSTINPQFVILKYISINEQYLTWVLQSSYARNNYNDFVLGTAIPTFTQVVLGNMPIPLPPISEQLKIVNKLKHLFLSINSLENNKKSLCTLIKESKSKVLDLAIHGKLVPQDPTDEPASELLKRINPKAEITCDNGHYQKLPEGWCECSFDDIFNITMGQSPNGSSINHQQGVEFHQGKILFGDKYLKQSDMFTDAPTKLATPNSLLLCVRAPVGVVNITQREICIGRGLCSLKPNAAINLDYAYHTLTTYQSDFESKSTGSTFKAISGSIIRKEVFALPPLKEQHRIVAKIEEIFAQLDAIETSL
ncbi:restriction endonuclease subunit S [Hallella faecis]|uniref:restriction endonuclease subunit S n=1 Tax=Hallella faecis TaxID=2841596 RepID=UPI003F89D0C1